MSSTAVSAAASAFLGAQVAPPPARKWSGAAATRIECSSRPQKKATAHHMKTRPKKTQPWDVRRKPTVYAPLPPLPPDWVVSEPAAATATADPPPSS